MCVRAINYSQWNICSLVVLYIVHIPKIPKSKLFEITSNSNRLVFQNTFSSMNSHVTSTYVRTGASSSSSLFIIRCECVNEFTPIQCIIMHCNISKTFSFLYLLQFSRHVIIFFLWCDFRDLLRFAIIFAWLPLLDFDAISCTIRSHREREREKNQMHFTMLWSREIQMN